MNGKFLSAISALTLGCALSLGAAAASAPPNTLTAAEKAAGWKLLFDFFPDSNHSRLVVQGNHVERWLNGEKVLAYEAGSDEVKATVAKSKFKKTPGFGEKLKGHILLTDHTDECWFRNLKIRELPAK